MVTQVPPAASMRSRAVALKPWAPTVLGEPLVFFRGRYGSFTELPLDRQLGLIQLFLQIRSFVRSGVATL